MEKQSETLLIPSQSLGGGKKKKKERQIFPFSTLKKSIKEMSCEHPYGAPLIYPLIE